MKYRAFGSVARNRNSAQRRLRCADIGAEGRHGHDEAVDYVSGLPEATVPTISSRTPGGHEGNCPLCGARVSVTPSAPLGDAPCPACGALIWPIGVGDRSWLLRGTLLSAELRERLIEEVNKPLDQVGSLDRVELLLELEEFLELEVPDEIVATWTTAADVLDWLAEQYDAG